jgi:hypothetical protein
VLGFSEDELKRMLTGAGAVDVRVGVGARKTGDPFTVLIACGTKPSAATHESHDNTKARKHDA